MNKGKHNTFKKLSSDFFSIEKLFYYVDISTNRDFCIECNINRATLYKKNSEGKNNYEVVIQFINSRGSEIKELTQRLIEKPRKENNNDIKKIRKLVMRDVEYMKLQDRVKELEKKIKSLEKENKELIKKQGMA